MDVRPIRNDADYQWALAQLDPYFHNEPEFGTAEGDRFEVLATLVEAYEAKDWTLPEVDPIDVIRAAMEDMGHSQSDLADIFGSRSHASEVLARKRPLSLEMIRRISEAWSVPVSLLVSRYSIDNVA